MNKPTDRPDRESPAPVVFIVSQPRAGSTLLQTMLAGHPDVLAPGEAWLMLPLTHAIAGSRRDVRSPYDQTLADDAVGEFVRSHVDGGWTLLQQELGTAATRLYAAARRRAGAEVLIDKTPRYYWIIEDLLAMVPDCRVIVLLRNPLAVLSSIVRTWTRPTRVGFLKDYRADLLEAPARLAAALQIDDPRIVSLRYEDLIVDPEAQLDRLQRFIGLRPATGLQHYGKPQRREYGDPSGIHQHQTIQRDSLASYLKEAARSPTLWRLMDDYRCVLGDRLLGRLGYDENDLQKRFAAVRPPGTRLAPTLASQVTRRPAEPRRSYIRLRRLVADGAGRFGRAA